MPSQLQPEVAARVADLVKRQVPPPGAPGEETALQELLRGASVYSQDGTDSTIAPFSYDMVALPSVENLASAPQVEEDLPWLRHPSA